MYLGSSKLHDALQQAILAGALQDTSANYSRDNPLSGGSTQKWPATGTQPERRGLCSSAGDAWRDGAEAFQGDPCLKKPRYIEASACMTQGCSVAADASQSVESRSHERGSAAQRILLPAA